MPNWLNFAFNALPTWVKPLLGVLAEGVAAAVVLWVLFKLLQWAAPKLAAIAWTTAKETFSQPLFYLLLGIGAFLLVLFLFIPYNTFGEDVKVIKDEGLTLVMVLSVILALWTASASIADEIEGRTALTLLSKPIARWQFIVGKFLGIIGPVAIMFIVLGMVFLASVSFKVVYDARETSQLPPTWQQCAAEVWQITPGLVLSFMEAVVLASISVAIATRLPMIPNLIICFSIYVLGHLAPLLLNSSARQIEPVNFMARLFATVLPVLDHFNITAAVSTGQPVPPIYLLWAAGYCVLYSSMAMVLALLLFEDRDLA
jgi:ABC-type transport system involved in multi-copper enzyme maturation permease subunit